MSEEAPPAAAPVAEKESAGGPGGEGYEDKPLEKGGENDCSQGPVKKRSCTDVFCLLLFIAHWVPITKIDASISDFDESM